MINIRRAQHSDAQDIITAHVRSIREVCAKDYTPEQIEAWAGRKFKSELWSQAMDRDYVWVVELNSQVKGFGHLAIMNANIGEVMGLYFTPELRGLKAGKKLFSEMVQEARKHGVKKLELHATLTAKTFYESLGFHQVEGRCSVEMQGVDIPCFPMECVIAW